MSVEYCGPYGLQTLCETLDIRQFDRTVRLTLDGPRYTDATIELICKLEFLQSLTLQGTRITEEGVDRIRQSLPNCRINR